MVRNADDIIGPVVSHMIEQVDHVIIADNLSTDNTREVLEGFGSKITLLEDNDPAYRQSEKMTELAGVAKRRGAQYVVPFDADEWWYSMYGTLSSVIMNSPATINVAPMYDHVPTCLDDLTIDDPIARIQWRRSDKTPLHKVACEVTDDLIIEMGNHNATYAHDVTYDDHSLLEVRHFPYRNADQFVAKAVVGAMALEMTDLPYENGQHWRDYARIYETQGIDALKQVFLDWFYSNDPHSDNTLIHDPII